MAVNVNIDLNVKQAQIKAQKLELQLEKVNEKIERQEDKIKQLNKELTNKNGGHLPRDDRQFLFDFTFFCQAFCIWCFSPYQKPVYNIPSKE